MRIAIRFSFVMTLLGFAACFEASAQDNPAFTLIALGDAGEGNRLLRANAETMNDMLIGRHDGGTFQSVLFLGDNFYNTGLNIPSDDVEGKIKSVLGPFREIFGRLGSANIHAIPGNHDYYRRNAIETSILFGLVSIEEAPVGLSDRGNEREAAIPYWTYHYRMPAQITYAIPGTTDSVQFILIDSSLPLRIPLAGWHVLLDSLEHLLVSSDARPGIRWRVLCAHHPWYSVGEHGGYSVWNDETRSVDYLTNCDRDSNAVSWLKNWLDPQDLCSEKYRAFADSVRSVVHRSRTKISLFLGAHDHSLQLLTGATHDLRCKFCPTVHIISGAACRPTLVKFPGPPMEFTSVEPDPAKKGISQPGFVQLRFTSDALRAVFYNGMTGDRIDMGKGREEFWITPDGALLDRAPGKN
jgi:hypothetical protein